MEPQTGGLYLVNVTGARFARGSFLREVVPVHRLAYSFGWDGSGVVPPGSSLVEIDLIEQPDGTLLPSDPQRPAKRGAMRRSRRRLGSTTSAGLPKLQPGATRARTPGTGRTGARRVAATAPR